MLKKSVDTKRDIVAAARQVLMERGYAGLSTRRVADAAGTQMSQIRYHFGSKEGLILAVFQDMNTELLDRQRNLFDDTSQPLSVQWDIACDYLDEDLASGYVRVLQELIAAGWSNPRIREEITDALRAWFTVLTAVAKRAESKLGPAGDFNAQELATLVATAFIGAEAYILLGFEEDEMPVKSALRRIGDIIRMAENATMSGED